MPQWPKRFGAAEIKLWLRSLFLLTFIGPCIANRFAEYNQQDAKFHNFFISVRRSTCFRRVFRPPSGAQNCIYSVRYLSDQYCYLPLARLAAGSSIGLTLYVQFWAPDDGRKNRLKHVERLTEINKLRNVAYCWLYSAKSVSVRLFLYLPIRISWKIRDKYLTNVLINITGPRPSR